MMKALRNEKFRFVITLILCCLYSFTKETSFSTFTKPLPVIYWLLVILSSPRIPSGKWVIASLSFAFLGDILLDLGENWLRIATIPFLSSTALLGWAFHVRYKNGSTQPYLLKRALILVLISLPIIFLYSKLIANSTDAIKVGSVLFTLSIFLLANAVSNLLLNPSEKTKLKPWVGLSGAAGIVANYLLYSVDLYLVPIPRDLVIQVYYWGTAMATWSFLK